jgi:hypothetical protein
LINEHDDIVQRWRHELTLAERREQKWRKKAEKIEKRYRNEGTVKHKTFNILWANTETLRPALYSNTARPDVRRRFGAGDTAARGGSMIIERAIEAMIDSSEFDVSIERTVQDMLLTGRGITRVHYKPKYEMMSVRGELTEANSDTEPFTRFMDENGDEKEPQFDDNGAFFSVEEETLVDETVEVEFVPWDQIRFGPARQWSEVNWIAFESIQTREDLIENFGDKGKTAPLMILPDGYDPDLPDDIVKRCRVWEIWDKRKREVIFIGEGSKEPLDVRDDPLNLKDFFPIPRPLYSIETDRTMLPVPEFDLYRDQADELDDITGRIDHLIKMLKVRGVYDAANEELGNLFNTSEGTMIPAHNWQAFSERGGFRGSMDFVPIESTAQVLVGMYQERIRLIQSIYELTGISDIQRGATDPRETKGAQLLKAQFSSLRLMPRQKKVERFVRDLFRLMAEIIGEVFSPETMTKMTGLNVTPEILELLRDDDSYQIEVETDSTVLPDDAADKAAVGEYLQAVAGFMQMQAQGGIPREVALKILLWASRRFKVSREIEDLIESSPQPPPGPDKQQTDIMKEQAKAQFAQQKLQLDVAKLDGEQRLKWAELELKERELEQEKMDIMFKAQAALGA